MEEINDQCSYTYRNLWTAPKNLILQCNFSRLSHYPGIRMFSLLVLQLKKHYHHRTGTIKSDNRYQHLPHLLPDYHYTYLACIVKRKPQLPASYQLELVNYRILPPVLKYYEHVGNMVVKSCVSPPDPFQKLRSLDIQGKSEKGNFQKKSFLASHRGYRTSKETKL